MFAVSAVPAQQVAPIELQGRLLIGEQAFDGDAEFRLDIVSDDGEGGTTTLWSHDGTGVDGAAPVGGITLPVTKGLFSIPLGDGDLTRLIDPEKLKTNNARVRIWFRDPAGDEPLRIVAEGIQFGTVVFAMLTVSVVDVAITTPKFADHAVTTPKLEDSAVGAEQLASSAVGTPQLADESVASNHLAASSVTTTKLGPAAVGESQLAANSVSVTKFPNASVATPHLGDHAANSDKLANLAVTTPKLGPASVGSSDLAPAAVSEAKLAAGAVLTSHLQDGAVQTSHLADGAVTNVKIADLAVSTIQLGAFAVENPQLGDGSLVGDSFADSALTGAHLEVAAVDNSHFEAAAVGSPQLADGSVTTAKLGGHAVTTGKLAEASVASVHLAAAAVDGTKLAPGAVTPEKIADLAVTTDRISDLAVGSAQLAPAAVGAEHIAPLSVDATHIAPGSVGTAAFAPESVGADQLGDIFVEPADLEDGGVTTAKLADEAVTTAKLAAESVLRGHLAAAAVDANRLDSGAVSARTLAAGAVTSDGIGPEAVATAALASSAVTADALANAAVAASKIAAGSVDSSKLADGAVTSSAIASSALDNSGIAPGAGIDDGKLAAITTSGKVANEATTATAAATPGSIARRDPSGNLSAGMISANLAGTATGNIGFGSDSIAGTLSAPGLASTAETGTPPFAVDSSSLVENLNVERVGGLRAEDLVNLTGGFATTGSAVFDDLIVNGRILSRAQPAGPAFSDAGFVIRPSAAAQDHTLLGVRHASEPLLRFDADGDLALAGNLAVGGWQPSPVWPAVLGAEDLKLDGTLRTPVNQGFRVLMQGMNIVYATTRNYSDMEFPFDEFPVRDILIGTGEVNLLTLITDPPNTAYGWGNSAEAGATVRGGWGNSSQDGTTAGGIFNSSSFGGVVLGGSSNVSAGGVILGGSDNQVESGTAGGTSARAGPASFSFSCWSIPNERPDGDFLEAVFEVYAFNGVRLYTGTGLVGPRLLPGSGSWSNTSDRDSKENFVPPPPGSILEALESLSIHEWNYRSQDASIRHVGPTAQDFNGAFGFGDSDRHITSIDAAGVVIAAIRDLHDGASGRADEIERQIRSQDRQIHRIERLIENLEKHK